MPCFYLSMLAWAWSVGPLGNPDGVSMVIGEQRKEGQTQRGRSVTSLHKTNDPIQNYIFESDPLENAALIASWV